MRSRRARVALWAAAIVAYLFLYLPLAIVVVYSFNDSRLNAEWVGFTLDWYRRLARNEEMITAAVNSLAIALAASVASTALGTMAGVAMHRYRLRLLPVLVLTPIAIPEILMGVAPQSRAASTRLSSMPASRARTTIATNPMQNAMWAMATDTSPSVKFSITKKIRSATPIRISGIAIGVSTSTGRRRRR